MAHRGLRPKILPQQVSKKQSDQGNKSSKRFVFLKYIFNNTSLWSIISKTSKKQRKNRSFGKENRPVWLHFAEKKINFGRTCSTADVQRSKRCCSVSRWRREARLCEDSKLTDYTDDDNTYAIRQEKTRAQHERKQDIQNSRETEGGGKQEGVKQNEEEVEEDEVEEEEVEWIEEDQDEDQDENEYWEWEVDEGKLEEGEEEWDEGEWDEEEWDEEEEEDERKEETIVTWKVEANPHGIENDDLDIEYDSDGDPYPFVGGEFSDHVSVASELTDMSANVDLECQRLT